MDEALSYTAKSLEVLSQTPSPKRRRIQDENEQPNATSDRVSGGHASEDKLPDSDVSTATGCKEPQQTTPPAAGECKQASIPAGLTDEQRARIERNRMLALQKKQQQDEQRARIERNRMLALQKKQQRQAAGSSAAAQTGQQSAAQPASQQPAPQPAQPLTAQPAEQPTPQPDEALAPQPDLSTLVTEVMKELAEADLGDAQSATSSSSSDDSDDSSDDGSSSSESSSEDSSSASSSSSKAEAAPSAPAASLTDEQRERVERNRQAAMERKRRLKEAPVVAQKAPTKDAATAPKELEYTPAEERDGKQKLVAQLLSRWWYVLPEWPPKEYDYEKELARRLLRCVSLKQWDREPELDLAGSRKVYALSQFPGLYRNSAGKMLDLRPIEGRPSYDRFITKPTAELYRLLLVAYRNQLQEAKLQINRGPMHKAHVEELQKRVNEVRSKAMFAMTFMKK